VVVLRQARVGIVAVIVRLKRTVLAVRVRLWTSIARQPKYLELHIQLQVTCLVLLIACRAVHSVTVMYSQRFSYSAGQSVHLPNPPSAPVVPKTKVVIALTGFDDKIDRTALIQTLRLFIKREKRAVATLSDSVAEVSQPSGDTGMFLDGATVDAAIAVDVEMDVDNIQPVEDTVNPTQYPQVVQISPVATTTEGDNTEQADVIDNEVIGGTVFAGDASIAEFSTTRQTNEADAECPATDAMVVALEVTPSIGAAQEVHYDIEATAVTTCEDGLLQVASNPSTVHTAGSANPDTEIISAATAVSAEPAAVEISTPVDATPTVITSPGPQLRARGRPLGSTKPQGASSYGGTDISRPSKSATRSSSNSRGGKTSADGGGTAAAETSDCDSTWHVDPTESSVSMTFEHNDFSAASCTHVVVSSKMRQP
jgi:hypothetical protein